MGRKLYRVPLDFAWPIDKVWRGFLNPFYPLQQKCSDCQGSGYTPEAKEISDQWYGTVSFDPRAYGATPITRDHPKIRAMAIRNVNRSPEYYLTPMELAREQDAGVGFSGDDVPSGTVRAQAVDREVDRLFRHFAGQWSHHLVQADVDALVAAGRLMDFTGRPRNQEQVDQLKAQAEAGGSGYWLKDGNGYCPTAQEVNDWSIGGMGHDSCNHWTCVKARCAREGIEVQCPRCQGTGEYWVDIPADDFSYLTRGQLDPTKVVAFQDRAVKGMIPASMIQEAYDAWEPREPPEGPGYQLWETTSEGSPQSPVFADLDELCCWAETNATTFGSNRTTKEQWRKMLDEDFVRHEEIMENGTHAVFL